MKLRESIIHVLSDKKANGKVCMLSTLPGIFTTQTICFSRKMVN